MELPILHIACLQHHFDDMQKLHIINLLLQQVHKNLMVYVVKRPHILIPLSTTHW